MSIAFKTVFFVGLFLLPLIVWTYSPTPFEVPRVWFLQRWVEVLAIICLFNLRRVENKPNTVLLVLPLLYLAASLYSSWQGVDWDKSLLGNFYRADGLLTLSHLVVLVIILALIWKREWQKTLAMVLTISSALLALWALDESVNLHLLKNLADPQFGGAVGASFGQPNFLAGYLLVTLPFSLYLYAQTHMRAVKTLVRLAIVFALLGIFLTMSWGGILGLLVLSLIYFSLSRYRLALKVGLGAVLVIVLAASLFYWAVSRPKFIPGRGEEFLHPESRVRIINNAVEAIRQKPLFGWGIANFDYAFGSNPKDVHYGSDVYVDKAHSIILENLVTTGAVGTTTYLLLVISLLFVLLKRLRSKVEANWHKALFASFLLYLVHSQTNVISINEELIFWLIAGILASRTT